MNPIRKLCMNIRGTIAPSQDYFARRCDAPTDLVKTELDDAISFAREEYDLASEAVTAAAHVTGRVQDHGLFTAKANIFYDPRDLAGEAEPLSAKGFVKHRKDSVDDTILSYISSKTYDNTSMHTHDTIHIPHTDILDDEPGLPRPNKGANIGLKGALALEEDIFPTINDRLKADYHS